MTDGERQALTTVDERRRRLLRTRVYCQPAEHAGHESLPAAIVKLLWKEHAAGVTVLSGYEGFGANRVVGRGAAHHPVVVEWLDTQERVDRIWPKLQPLVADVVVTQESVEVISGAHRARPRLDPHCPVSEVMGDEVVSVGPAEPLEGVARLMFERDLRFLPVVDSGRLVGVVTNGDLVRHGVTPLRLELHRALDAAPDVAATGTAADVMTTAVVSVAPSTSIVDAARLMVDRRVKRLPVADHGRLVGVVSRFDILRSAAATDARAEPHPITGEERTAGDIARHDVPTVHPDTPVSDVLDAVASTRLNRAVVVDADGRVVGVISDVALLTRIEAASEGLLARLMRRVHAHPDTDPALEARTAADLMISPPGTVLESASIEEAVRAIVENGRKILPVVDADGRLVGAVDRSDALRALTLHGGG